MSVQCVKCKMEFKSDRALYSHYSQRHNEDVKQKRTIFFKEMKKKNGAKYSESPVICVECKSELPYEKRTNKFCNSTCSAKHNNRKTKTKTGKYKKIKNCRYCGKEHYRFSSQLCSQLCFIYERYEDKTINDVINRGGANTYDRIRNSANSIAKYLGYDICCVCDYDKHVEMCHIKAISSFDKNTKLLEVNSIENIVHLCPNCHWEYDNGLLTEEHVIDCNNKKKSGSL